jgi:septum site-determining protein MinC
MGQKQQQQNVTIKGKKDGLILYLNDSCSFEEVLNELEEKLSSSHHHHGESPLVSVHIKAGYRYLTPELESKIRDLIRGKKNLVVDSIDSEVMTKKEAIEWKKSTDIHKVSKMVRSGQILEVQGDLLLIGDVNPGGTVKAGGNIFIMGALRGIAHAGCYGDEEAVITASLMKPSQLRIGNYISRSPDFHSDEKNDMECAFIDLDKNHIIIDRVQVLSHLRPNLTRLERGM